MTPPFPIYLVYITANTTTTTTHRPVSPFVLARAPYGVVR